jgi:hypothetical protein
MTGGQWRSFNPEIDWFLNEAPALLGEQGSAFGETSGAKDGNEAASRAHDRFIRAVDHATRYRGMERTWRALAPRSRDILAARYSRKRYWEIRGLKAVFEDLSSVALVVTTDRPALEAALQKASARQIPIVTETRRRVDDAVGDAHDEWAQLRRGDARKWAEG